METEHREPLHPLLTTQRPSSCNISVTRDILVSHSHILGDGAIDVRDYDLVVPAPQIDGALAATCSLVLSGYAEGDMIRSVS